MPPFKPYKNMFGSKVTGYYKPPVKVTKATKKYVKKAIQRDALDKGWSDRIGTGLVTEPGTDTAAFVLVSEPNDATDEGIVNGIDGTTLRFTRLEGSITYTNTAATEHNMRLIILYDRMPDLAVPAVTDYLLSSKSLSLLNHNTQMQNRFIVIKDYSFKLGGNTDATPDTAIKRVTLNKTLKLPRSVAIATGFAGNSAAAYLKGTLVALSIGDVAAASMTIATDWNVRTHFVY